MSANGCRAVVVVLLTVGAAWAGQVEIDFVSDVALDQPRVAVYLRGDGGILPEGTEGWAVPGLLDTGAAAHVLPAYLRGPDALNVPIDPAGEAEVLTLCGYVEYLDITYPLHIGVGPYDSENEADYVEVGPHRVVVRRVDPPGSDLLLYPMIVGTPFFLDYAIRVEWQLIEIWPGIELPQLVTQVRPVDQSWPGPVDLTIDLTLAGEVNLDVGPSLPTAYSVAFLDVVLRSGEARIRRPFLLDTGAQISFISTELAEAVGIDLDSPAGSGLQVIGAGTCQKTIYPYLVDELILHTRQGVALIFQQPLLYVLDVPGIDGGIGSNMLFFFDALDAVDINLDTAQLGLALNVPIPPAGDVDGSGTVDVFDVILMINSFGSRAGEPAYDDRLDVNGNDMVDVLDVLAVVRDFGESVDSAG